MVLKLKESQEIPLPSVELLKQYEKLGINEDLIKLVKQEQLHRHKLQNQYLLYFQLGQICSICLSLFVFTYVYKLMRLKLFKEASILLMVFIFLIFYILLYFIKVDKKLIKINFLKAKKKVIAKKNKIITKINNKEKK